MLLLLVIFFTTPLLSVLLMYRYDWKPAIAKSAGELIRPARAVPQIGTPTHRTDWHGYWRLVYVTHACDVHCQQTLDGLRRLHLSLYKDAPRLQRVLIVSDTTGLDVQAKNKLLVWQAEPANIQKWQTFFNQDRQDHQIYLIDPHGYFVMRYSTQVSWADMRRDIVRLLRYAWSG